MNQAISPIASDAPAQAVASPRLPRQPPRFSGRNPYSIFVASMKILLPAMAVAMILVVVAWPQFSAESDRFRVDLAELGLGKPDSVRMLNARFDGIDGKNRPYSITADMAIQSDRDENIVVLELPKGDITLKDGVWLALTARAGQYDRASELLDLAGAVTLFHDQGFEMQTESARIDLAQGTVVGTEPVDGHGTAGSIVAQGFQIFDSGERIVFTGKSHLVILSGRR